MNAVAVMVCAAPAMAESMNYADRVLADNPLAYYRFESDTAVVGSVCDDVTSNDNDGVYGGVNGAIGAGPSLVDGLSGNALDVTGVNCYADIGVVPGFFGAISADGGGTLEMWVKGTGTTRTALVGNYSDSGNHFMIYVDRSPENGADKNDAMRVFTHWKSGGPDYDTDITDGVWKYLAVVVDYSNPIEAERLKMYMADEGDAQVTELTGLVPLESGANPNSNDFALSMLIGSVNINGTPSSMPINAMIDEVAFYGEPLTQSQLDYHLAVPEPSTLVLLIAGALGLLACTRRK